MECVNRHPICAECGRVIEGKDLLQSHHPVTQWVYACHVGCWTGRFPWEQTPRRPLDMNPHQG